MPISGLLGSECGRKKMGEKKRWEVASKNDGSARRSQLSSATMSRTESIAAVARGEEASENVGRRSSVVYSRRRIKRTSRWTQMPLHKCK